MNCWDKNEIDFHAIVSGFLASPEQIHPRQKKLSIDLPIMAKWLSLILQWLTMVAFILSTLQIWLLLCANSRVKGPHRKTKLYWRLASY